jgi:hypothetical protein
MGRQMVSMSLEDKMSLAADIIKPNIKTITEIFTGVSKDYSLQDLSDYVWSKRLKE